MRAENVRRGTAFATVALFATTALAACNEDTLKEQSLCTVYGEYLDHLAEIGELDAESLTAAEAAEVADDYVASIQRVQHATEDDRNNNGLLVLETAARDLHRTLASVPDDVEYDTWSPLVEDDLEAVRNAALIVDEALAAECPEAGELR